MEKIKINSVSLLAIAISAIAIVMVNAVVNPLQEAWALSYITVTTNGTQSNDNCVSAIDDVTDVWLLCNASPTGASSTLSVVNSATGNQLATFATGITFSTVNQLLPLYANSQSILLYSRSGFIKYSFDGTSITQTGSLTLSSCTNTASASAGYDNKGYLWYSCPTQQTVGAMNPATMTDLFRSSAITLGNGFPSTCLATNTQDAKAYWFNIAGGAFGTANGLVFVNCNNPQMISFFDVSFSGGAITQGTHKANSVVTYGLGGGAFPQLYLDGDNKRLFFNDATNGIDTYTYTVSGVTNFVNSMTSEHAAIGATGQYNCYSDFYLTSTGNQHIIYCAGNNVVEGFMSNATLATTTFNIGSFSTTYSALIRPIATYNAGNFVVANGLLDGGTQKFLFISGTSTTYSPPVATPPTNSTGSTNNTCGSTSITPHCIGQINCDLSQNQGRLMCDTLLHGSQPLASASETVGNSTNFIFSQVGLVPAGSNIKTNGVGYVMVAVAEGILISMFFLATKGEISKIPNFVWMIGTLTVVGSCTAFGFVDVTFFLIAILVIIALASAKILSQLELGSFK